MSSVLSKAHEMGECLCLHSLMHTHDHIEQRETPQRASSPIENDVTYPPFQCLRTTNHLLHIYNTYPHPPLEALSAKYPQVGDHRHKPTGKFALKLKGHVALRDSLIKATIKAAFWAFSL